MSVYICIFMRIKLPLVICTRTCAARNYGAKATFAVVRDAGNSRSSLQYTRYNSTLKTENSWVKTLTLDNSNEFANHQAIDQALELLC
jgi:hypothetical protein